MSELAFFAQVVARGTVRGLDCRLRPTKSLPGSATTGRTFGAT